MEDSTMEKLITRRDLMKKLEAIGINSKLLQMPSVLERLYLMYREERQLEESILNGEIRVSDNGDFSFGNSDISFDKEHNTAKLKKHGFNSEDKFIYIDKFGMDSRVVIPSSSLSESMDLPDGKSATRYYDINAIEFDNYKGHYERELKIDGGNFDIESAAVDPEYKEDWKKIWNNNREFLLQNYPLTQGWFEERENLGDNIKGKENNVFTLENTDYELSEEIINSRKLLAEATERIAQLIRENEEKDSKIENLERDKSNLQSMLKHSLQLCEDVKRSWIGKFFFKNQLKQLNESQKEI